MSDQIRHLTDDVLALAQTADPETAERVRDESLARMDRGESPVYAGAAAFFDLLLSGKTEAQQ